MTKQLAIDLGEPTEVNSGLKEKVVSTGECSPRLSE